MMFPEGFDEANKNRLLERRFENAKELGESVQSFIKDVNTDRRLTDKQKRRIIDKMMDKIFKD